MQMDITYIEQSQEVAATAQDRENPQASNHLLRAKGAQFKFPNLQVSIYLTRKQHQ